MIDEDIRDALEVLEGIFEWKETTHNSDSYGQKGLATAIEVLKQYLSEERVCSNCGGDEFRCKICYKIFKKGGTK